MVSPAQKAIALLIDLAEQGEIDPWDVQVVEVIDRFLAEIPDYLELSASGYESNLSASGQTFLYAAMLVLFKAETLARMDAVPDEDGGEWESEEPLPDNVIPLPRNLERQLRRRAVVQPPANRPVSLGELIEQLELMAEVLEAPPRRGKVRRPKPPTEKQASQAIQKLSSHENPAELAHPIGQFLEGHWLRLAAGNEWLEFNHLVAAWHSHNEMHSTHSDGEGTSPAPDPVGVFWALLLLSAQSRVELDQSTLYGPLRIALRVPGTQTDRTDTASDFEPEVPLAASS